MRERWIDNGNGRFKLETDRIVVLLESKAHKNYRNTSSTWSLFVYLKNNYGIRFFQTFGCTMEEAFSKVESWLNELYDALDEIIK